MILDCLHYRTNIAHAATRETGAPNYGAITMIKENDNERMKTENDKTRMSPTYRFLNRRPDFFNT
jgi:hypothetical protein